MVSINKISKRTKLNISLLLIILIIYLIVSVWLRLPWYILLFAYTAAFTLLAVIFRKNLIAVMGNLYFASGQPEKAAILLKKAIAMNTTVAAAYLNYSIMLLRNGNWKDSLDNLTKAEHYNQDILTEKNIYLTRGSCYWLKGDIKKAIEVLEELRNKYDYVNENVLVTLAYMYFLDNNLDDAMELTLKAIQDAPESASAWDNLGQIYYRKGDTEKAKESYIKALSFNETLVDSLYFLGEIYENEKQYDKAAGLFVKAYECNISALNTVSKEQVQLKYDQYSKIDMEQ